MAKIIDITDKLNFEEKPKIVINSVEIEVNNKAIDILKITPTLQKDSLGVADIMMLYETLFSPKSQKEIEKMNLSFKDFNTVIMQAAQLIADTGAEGET